MKVLEGTEDLEMQVLKGRTTELPVREGPLLRRCVVFVERGLVSAVYG